MMTFNEGEEEVWVVRKHWLVFVMQMIVAAVGAVLPYVLLRIVPLGSLLASVPNAVAGPLLAFGYMTWLLILWVGLFYGWTMYYLNVWIVTSERIIDVHQRGLFSRELLTAELERVQDVTVDTEGLFQTLFDYGALTIHTAGEGSNFIITAAAHPSIAREKIMAEHDRCERIIKGGL